jgi:hypothetical protein
VYPPPKRYTRPPPCMSRFFLLLRLTSLLYGGLLGVLGFGGPHTTATPAMSEQYCSQRKEHNIMPAGWHKPFLLTVLGAVLAMSTTVTSLLATLLTPVLSAVTGGKASYS